MSCWVLFQLQGEFLPVAGRGGYLSMLGRTSSSQETQQGNQSHSQGSCGTKGKEARKTRVKSVSVILLDITDTLP